MHARQKFVKYLAKLSDFLFFLNLSFYQKKYWDINPSKVYGISQVPSNLMTFWSLRYGFAKQAFHFFYISVLDNCD